MRAVTVVASGGFPVVDTGSTKLGLPVTEVPAAYGRPVTKVTHPYGGLPVCFISGPVWLLNQGGIVPTIDMFFASGAYYGRDPTGLTVSRGSIGYADDKDGNWTQFAINVPRITNKGLLVEETRTNTFIRSQEFDQSAWVKTDTTVTANATAAPDGTLTADLLTEGTAGTAQTVQAATAVTASLTHAASIFLKPGPNTTWMRCIVSDSTATHGANFWFNLATGVAGTLQARGTGAPVSGRVVPAGNGFVRVEVVVTFPAAVSNIQLLVNSATGDLSTTRVQNAGYYAWQGQAEINTNSVSSPILTTTAAAARANETVTLASPPAFGNAMTLFAEGVPLTPTNFTGQRAAVFASDGTANNRSGVYHPATFNSVSSLITAGGAAATGQPASIAAMTQFQSSKFALASAAGNAALAANNQLTTGSLAGAPAGAVLTQFHFGNNGSGGSFWNGYLRRVGIWPTTRIANAQLQAMTVAG